MDQAIQPVFDVFPLGADRYADYVESDVFYTPNTRGVALFVDGAADNPSGKYIIHLIGVDLTSGKTITGKGAEVDLALDDLQLVTYYPSPFSSNVLTDIQTTLPVYWKIGVKPPGSGPYQMTIGAQLLL